METKYKIRNFQIIPYEEGAILKDPLEISKEMFFNRTSLFLLSVISENSDIKEIKTKFFRNTGILLSELEIENFIKELDKNFFFYNERFFQKLKEEERKFINQEFKKIEIDYNAIKEKFWEKIIDVDNKNIKGVIIPHIDINIAFDTYTRVFSYIKNNSRNIFFIFGVPHFFSKENFVIYPKDFKINHKIIKSNKELIEKINKKLNFNIYDSLYSFKKEHSIDFPIIFLSIVKENFSVIPSLVPHIPLEKMKELAENIYESLKEFEERLFFISSIDLSHTGVKFGDLNIIEPEKVDKKYLELLSNLKNEEAFEFLENKNNFTRIDGHYTNFLFLEVLKKFGISKGEILEYKIYREYQTNSLVSYGALIFE